MFVDTRFTERINHNTTPPPGLSYLHEHDYKCKHNPCDSLWSTNDPSVRHEEYPSRLLEISLILGKCLAIRVFIPSCCIYIYLLNQSSTHTSMATIPCFSLQILSCIIRQKRVRKFGSRLSTDTDFHSQVVLATIDNADRRMPM